MAELSFKNVSKRYDDVVAVENLNLTIRDGEFFVLLGPSGCGKSTALRMMLGLETPSEGSVRIDGVDVTKQSPGKRELAAVFQSDSLYRHMTVYDNIAFPLIAKGMEDAEIKTKVRKVSDKLGLAALLERRPRELSGGECRRVAIARALVCEPCAFLMDEPLTGLDADLRGQLREELADLHRQSDTTFLYVTHDQTEAMALGDRIAVMREGRLVQVGSPYDVYSSPADVFVAGFLGSPGMNLLPASLVWEEGNAAIKVCGVTLSLDVDRSALLAALGHTVGSVTVGVRPERICVKETGKGIEVHAAQAELTGAHVIQHFEDGEGRRICVLMSPQEAPMPGEWRVLSFSSDDICLFDVDGCNLEQRAEPNKVCPTDP